MSDTYYRYREVKVMIAHKLMKMDGWKVYGYKEDRSDPMTDYWDPADWSGIAEKNGYVLCVNVYGAAKPQEIHKYDYDSVDKNIADKIEKLKQMTTERGASEQEEESAKRMIEKLQNKANETTDKYIVTGIIPGHMENPPRMNWHIEKDGIYIAKGNGILKFAQVDDYYRYDVCIEDMKKFKTMNREEYKNSIISTYMCRWDSAEEEATKQAEDHIKKMEEDKILVDKFEEFINKIDTTCGGMIGKGDGVVYEKVKVTKYKTENKVVETESGSIKDGQCFILKSSFNYCRHKGYVYRIKANQYDDGKILYHAYRLNGKLTKERTGNADQSNHWLIGSMTENFMKWINKGAIAWCEIQEVKIPYEVEKVVKKTIKNKPENTTTNENIDTSNYTYEVTEDVDTRTEEKIYLVKVTESLSREEYIKVNQYMRSIGGYYSKFKHAFLFKENPCEKLNTELNKSETETAKPTEEQLKITYTVIEDIHTKTGEKLYIVKPDIELSKVNFAEIKRKLATLQGFYSNLKEGFIFRYDPTEKLTQL